MTSFVLHPDGLGWFAQSVKSQLWGQHPPAECGKGLFDSACNNTTLPAEARERVLKRAVNTYASL